jgi:hypothetical protein
VSAGGDHELVREDGTVQESGGVVLVHEWKDRRLPPAAGYIGSRCTGARALCGDRVVVEPADGLPARRPGTSSQSHSVASAAEVDVDLAQRAVAVFVNACGSPGPTTRRRRPDDSL